jgi:aquaporin Z
MVTRRFTIAQTARAHWPEYLMEAGSLALFMIAAGCFGIFLFHPGSPVPGLIPDGFVRRILMGLAMGLSAIVINYSPWARQSGGHLNPAVTLTFLRLGKVAPVDAAFYIGAQFTGGVLGILVVAGILGAQLANPAVNYVATLPGPGGAGAAFLGEAVISFVLMSVVLIVSNRPGLARYTPVFAGACVAAFITFEEPISGMSMNPARTFGSAVLPQLWTSLWVYFLAPPLGMLLSATVYKRVNEPAACAKLYHHNSKRCIFCNHRAGTL